MVGSFEKILFHFVSPTMGLISNKLGAICDISPLNQNLKICVILKQQYVHRRKYSGDEIGNDINSVVVYKLNAPHVVGFSAAMECFFGGFSAYGTLVFSLNERAENAVDKDSHHRNNDDYNKQVKGQTEEYPRYEEHPDTPRKCRERAEKADASRKTALDALHSANIHGVFL